MAIFYHNNPCAFYDEDFHGARKMSLPDPVWEAGAGDTVSPPLVLVDNPYCKIPADAKMITPEWHEALLLGASGGKLISEDDEGNPVLIDPPPPSPEDIAAVERAWRDTRLAATDGAVTRHRDELEESIPTSLKAEQYAELQVYRRELRDWPQVAEFPLVDHRPVAPTWLSGQLQ
ncbi:phage tail assembly chaperone [Pseudomonas frederiksbergensis]|uniref:phage tail assembly chaperone n=1 Tax=Pseudomonas frederiksbergensis TaxID=104087 RepID=UPI003D08D871